MYFRKYVNLSRKFCEFCVKFRRKIVAAIAMFCVKFCGFLIAKTTKSYKIANGNFTIAGEFENQEAPKNAEITAFCSADGAGDENAGVAGVDNTWLAGISNLRLPATESFPSVESEHSQDR